MFFNCYEMHFHFKEKGIWKISCCDFESLDLNILRNSSQKREISFNMTLHLKEHVFNSSINCFNVPWFSLHSLVARAGANGIRRWGDILHAHAPGPVGHGRGDNPMWVLRGESPAHDAGRHGNQGEKLLQEGKFCFLLFCSFSALNVQKWPFITAFSKQVANNRSNNFNYLQKLEIKILSASILYVIYSFNSINFRVFMPPPFEEWWRALCVTPVRACLRPSGRPSVIKIFVSAQ